MLALTVLEDLTLSHAASIQTDLRQLVTALGRLSHLALVGCALQTLPDDVWGLPRLQVRPHGAWQRCLLPAVSCMSTKAEHTCGPCTPGGSVGAAMHPLGGLKWH